MDVSEINQVVEVFKSNLSSGLLVVTYYLLLYGRRIAEGLGFFQSKGLRADDIQRRLEVEKLKIELAQFKRESGLEESELRRIESETLEQLGPKNTRPFSNKQKFVAIPLLLLLSLIAFSEINALQGTDGHDQAVYDTIIGYVFVGLIVIVGFWGMEALQKVSSSRLRTTAFVVFWSLAFTLIGALIASLIEMITTWPLTADEYLGFYYLAGFILSLILGLTRRLPGMAVRVKT